MVLKESAAHRGEMQAWPSRVGREKRRGEAPTEACWGLAVSGQWRTSGPITGSIIFFPLNGSNGLEKYQRVFLFCIYTQMTCCSDRRELTAVTEIPGHLHAIEASLGFQ